MKRFSILLSTLIMASGAFLFAHGGGAMGGGMMGDGMGGAMVVLADDGSLLLNDMSMMSGGMMGGGTSQPGLINISPDGAERWTATFDEGWPMMPVTNGNLVVVVLVDNSFMVGGGMGSGGWNGPAKGGDMGGGMGDGDMGDGDMGGSHNDQVVLLGLNLTTGQEVWRKTLAADMASSVQFSPDGSRLYISLNEMGDMGGGMGGGPMNQGDSSGAFGMVSTTILALDRDGAELWTYSSSDDSNPIADGGF